MKVLLVAVNAKYIHSNLAVYSLKAYAGCSGEEIGIVEYTVNQPLDVILMDLYKHRPDILCFSCYLWNISYVSQIMVEIVKVLPAVKVWVGGPEVSYNALDILSRYPMVSGVMCGEGEETFLELVQCWSGNGKPVEEIKGIVYRDGEGVVRENPARPPIDLSTVPFVYRQEGDFQNRILYYESSRGCPFACSYCLSSIDRCLRFRDVELVKEELQFFIDHGVPQVKFVDRTFNCRHDHAREIWQYIMEHDRGVTNFHFEISADLLTDEEIRLINSMRPGLVQLEIGVQSTNEQTIRRINRTMRFDRVRSAVARIREKGNVHQHLDLIAGLPLEDYGSFRRSFNDVYALKPQQLQLGFLKVLKGSEMYERAGEYGIVWQDRPPYEVLRTKWLSYGEIIRLKQIEEMVEVYYNSAQFRNTLEHLEQEFPDAFDMYRSLAGYYEQKGYFKVNHSRIARYEILFGFICGTRAENADQYREWLTLDMYLRDNVRNRPDFLGESRVTKEEASAFYKREADEHWYLRGYEKYDSRQMRKMTHLERIGDRLLLFDYRNRDPLTSDAAVYEVQSWAGCTERNEDG